MERVTAETQGWITTVTLRRPEALNALDAMMTAELTGVLHDLQHDDATRVIVLTGEGRGFCAGADLSGVADLAGSAPTPAQLRQLTRRDAARLARTLYETEKPIVAAVNGPAAGAGAAIAVSADVTVMADTAMLSFLFVERGLVPDYGATWLLPRLVGLRTARRLCLFGERLRADEALRLGLVDGVVPHEQLLDEALGVAQRLVDGPGVALGLTKRLLAEAFDSDHASAIDREFTAQSICLTTEDAVEGMTAFLQKRSPQFRWR
ncbi:MAG TPA: enoyl-CoA hydratase-related protein [Egibacteraceae bacterium]|nr:enoyl-CoA hydratase-related protein [Egibacteraceae bacterium]